MGLVVEFVQCMVLFFQSIYNIYGCDCFFFGMFCISNSIMNYVFKEDFKDFVCFFVN